MKESPSVPRSFDATLADEGFELRRGRARVLQVNVGKLCNQTCVHCHVGAGPGRKEVMAPETADRIIAWMRAHPPELLDVTGGAPELCPEFRRLVVAGREVGARVMVRCNLTVFYEPGQGDLPEFYREHGCEIVASLPCYSSDNVDKQRGNGVFEKSIGALQQLNGVGYGRGGDLPLWLVYNPLGPTIAPSEDVLEPQYKKHLKDNFGIEFDRLICITNLPVTRFRLFLEQTGQLESYHQLLLDHFNPATVDGLMCRDTINVGWEGDLFDCDFNQMVGLAMGGRPRRYLWDVEPADLEGDRIATGSHCFGCTAGHGTSCGGTLA